MSLRKISTKAKNRFKKAIQEVIEGLGVKVQVYKQSLKSECPNCFYDKLTDSSTGKCKWTALEATNNQIAYIAAGNIGLRYKFFKVGRCPVCKGKGFLETPRKVWINSLVTWNPLNRGNDLRSTSAGFEGATIAELKTDPKYYTVFKDCKKVIIEGNSCKLVKPPVLRGLGNNAVLVVTVFTTDTLDVERDGILKQY